MNIAPTRNNTVTIVAKTVKERFQVDEMDEWCLEHLGRDFYWQFPSLKNNGSYRLKFAREQDRVLFLLRWS